MNSTSALGEGGPLAQHITGFTPRSSQLEMAEEIESVISNGEILVAESGTGTGKTYAYLVPALLSGKRVLISTGTRHLQDQLFKRDLPQVMHALGMTTQAALLKGRSNYLCNHRLEQAELEARFGEKKQSAQFGKIKRWAGETRTGDIAEVGDIPEDSPVWYWVTSTTDNCLGGRCEHYERCHVVKARQKALQADIVVVNHHLFFADLAVKEEGFGELLPGAETVIFDEAHQLPDVASNFFGSVVSANQFNALSRDVTTEELREQSLVKGLTVAADKLQTSAADFRLAFGVKTGRGVWRDIKSKKAIVESLTGLAEQLTTLRSLLEPAATHGSGLANCYRRCTELLERLAAFHQEESGPDFVSWYETTKRGFVLRLTPVDVSTQFQAHMQSQQCAWVFTSATLAIGDDLGHYCRQLGLEDVITRRWESPFDFQSNALLYIPEELPEPNHPDFINRFMDCAVPVLEASNGHAFVLVTSYRALNILAEQLPGRIDFPLLVQGQSPRAQLLQQFRETPNAVLLGTGSFWEGVDVQGEHLSCVIIDKLPFAAPDDPVVKARARAIEAKGGNAFMGFHVPNAVVSLKQGAGRLIRSETDRGVLMIGDRRLVSKGYGRVFIRSLPPMRRVSQLEEVEQFFNV